MQATSPVYRPTTDTGWLTTTSLVLIAIFAAITVIAILYGMRLRAQRRAARKIEERRVEAETRDTPQPVAAPAEVAAPSEPEPVPTPPPVAPAPPPLDSWAAPGTPAADPLPESPDVADEPIAAAAPFEASPAVEAESAPDDVPAAVGGPDPGERPLTTLKGLGPKVAARLEELGVTNVGDLAALDEAQAAGVDARLGPFTGRMTRDRWLEQARLLAAGDDKAFEAAFGKL